MQFEEGGREMGRASKQPTRCCALYKIPFTVMRGPNSGFFLQKKRVASGV